jgi:hypothetical protein
MRSSTQPQFWQADRLHIVVAWEAIFAVYQPDFSFPPCFFRGSFLVEKVAKPL